MRTLGALLEGTRDVYGTWSQMAAPEAIDILGAAGLDFTIIDAEHGSFGMEAVENLVRSCNAADLVALVRVPTAEQMHITRALDAGAAGVVVPGIDSAEDARRAIEAGCFAPSGGRGACPCVRAGGHWVEDWPAYVRRCEADTGIVVLAETPGALADIDAICALRGLRAVMIGPFDLAVAMGFRGDYRHPAVSDALQRIASTAQSHGVPVMVPVFAPELDEARRQADAWRARGVRIFALGTDKILLHSQCTRLVSGLVS